MDVPPIGVPPEGQMELLASALEKAGNATLFVYRNVPLPEAYLNSDAYNEDYRFIQAG